MSGYLTYTEDYYSGNVIELFYHKSQKTIITNKTFDVCEKPTKTIFFGFINEVTCTIEELIDIENQMYSTRLLITNENGKILVIESKYGNNSDFKTGSENTHKLFKITDNVDYKRELLSYYPKLGLNIKVETNNKWVSKESITNRETDFKNMYMNMAKAVSDMSRCKRKQVGSVIVKDGNIIAFGYNGTPSGFENGCECENGETKNYVLHAEANAILKVAKSTLSSSGSTLYTTLSPCVECSKLIIQADISKVVYLDDYKTDEGLKLLNKANIKIEKLN